MTQTPSESVNVPRTYERRYHEEQRIAARPEAVFSILDDHAKLSAHMAKPSWRTLWSSMALELDEGGGQQVGSHIKMESRILGIRLHLDEVVTRREPPRIKEWETTGQPRLLVVGYYRIRADIEPDEEGGARVRVSIDYDLPTRQRWLGRLLGGWYARWCVRQMTNTLAAHFETTPIAATERAGTRRPA